MPSSVRLKSTAVSINPSGGSRSLTAVHGRREIVPDPLFETGLSGHLRSLYSYEALVEQYHRFSNGEGELDDSRVALELLRSRYPDLPLTLAGFSFGSRIALRLACEANYETNPSLRRVIAVGFPTVYKNRSFLDTCTVPRTFVQSTHDQFGPVEELHALVDALPEPKQLIWIEARDHFFVDALEKLEETIAGLN